MKKIVESFELYGKQYRLETGELAKQATGSVVVTQGDTTVLVTAVISKEEKDYDFFPLTVDFIEKMYAVGRIPGGYLKREARPSDTVSSTNLTLPTQRIKVLTGLTWNRAPVMAEAPVTAS